MPDLMDVTPRSNAAALLFAIPANRWSDEEAAGKSPEDLLLYRSNRLGSDLTVTNSAAATPRPSSTRATRSPVKPSRSCG